MIMANRHMSPEMGITSTNIMMIIATSRPITAYGKGDFTNRTTLPTNRSRSIDRCLLGLSTTIWSGDLAGNRDMFQHFSDAASVVDTLIGDFTSLSPLAVTASNPSSVRDRRTGSLRDFNQQT